MKRLIIAAMGLALVVGVIIGGIVGNPFSSARAATTVNRQAEITLLAFPNLSFDGDPGEEYQETNNLATIDTTKFPIGTTFTFDVGGRSGNGSHCFRLVEWGGENTFTPVSGSEVCTPGGSYRFILQSGPLTLSAGEHGYSYQRKNVDSDWNSGAAIGTIRVLAEWAEPSVVGGIAEAPAVAGATGTGTSGMGSGTYAVLVGAVSGVLAFAVLGTLAAKRRGVQQ